MVSLTREFRVVIFNPNYMLEPLGVGALEKKPIDSYMIDLECCLWEWFTTIYSLAPTQGLTLAPV